jgi:hypothetical protein
VTAALGGVVVMGVIGGAVGRQMAARSEAMAAGAGDAAAGGGGGANAAGGAAGYGRGTVLLSILVILDPGRFFWSEGDVNFTVLLFYFCVKKMP